MYFTQMYTPGLAHCSYMMAGEKACIVVDPARDEVVRVELEKALPEIPAPEDTRYVKHVRIQSERLTKFWGRPMLLGAVVLLLLSLPA